MFYLILIFKLLILLFLPIYLFRIIQKSDSFSKRYINITFLLFIIYLSLLTYIPFTFYYFENEVNIQTFLPFYSLIGFIIFYSILPISFFVIQIKKIYIQSLFNKAFKIFGLICLVVTALLIAGIEIFNFINLQALHEICYISHDSSNEKLRCCLDADYVWKEGFAFSKNTPNECDKYMNWNN
ncbi:MAG: hypothetical protein ACJZ38_03975 [Candidatus Pelagibacterales bacterium]